MSNPESLEEFYKRKFDSVPEKLRSEIGHLNVFQLEPYLGENAESVPYKRRDFYKIMLTVGSITVHYADKSVKVKKQSLSFSNPQIPYCCDHTERISEGVFCIFNKHFFYQYGDLSQYAVFQPNGEHVFELTDAQYAWVARTFKQMSEELNSEYIHKYDVLRNLVFDLIHFALKIQPPEQYYASLVSASQRIAMLFIELLERQFPIEENHPRIQIHTASEFARQLNIHVNHLNRAVKKVTGKTTSQLIAERLLQEAKVMLKHSALSIAEIAYALGFSEPTHFSNFFKKHLSISPSIFRKS